jgi:hypothetical protein
MFVIKIYVRAGIYHFYIYFFPLLNIKHLCYLLTCQKWENYGNRAVYLSPRVPVFVKVSGKNCSMHFCCTSNKFVRQIFGTAPKLYVIMIREIVGCAKGGRNNCQIEYPVKNEGLSEPEIQRF